MKCKPNLCKNLPPYPHASSRSTALCGRHLSNAPARNESHVGTGYIRLARIRCASPTRPESGMHAMAHDLRQRLTHLYVHLRYLHKLYWSSCLPLAKIAKGVAAIRGRRRRGVLGGCHRQLFTHPSLHLLLELPAL